MDRLRVSRATLGSPVWTCATVDGTVYVTIDHDCPSDDASVEACIREMIDAGVDVADMIDGPALPAAAELADGERPGGR